MVEVAGPKIEKMEEHLQQTQKDVKTALDRPLELGEEAVSSFIAEIEGPVKQMIARTKCALPDTRSLVERIADAVKAAAKAGIAETTLNIEIHHSVRLEEDTKERMERNERRLEDISSVRLEEDTKERMERNERRLEDISKSFHVKPLEFWERLLLMVETGVIAAAILTAAICIPVHKNSAEHWGKRYHAVCNHPLQQNETILSHRGDAYELVLAFFDKGGDEREKMKAHIREQEQKLKRLEIDASGGKDPAKKP